jgi:hypothetical protein
MDDTNTAAPTGVAPDISQYELEDVYTFTVKNARGDDNLKGLDGLPVMATVYSPGSDQGRKADLRANRQQQLRLYRGMRGESSPQDAVDQEADGIEKLVAYTRGFSPNFPFTPAQVIGNRKLIYVAKQLESAIGGFGNFSKGSSTS